MKRINKMILTGLLSVAFGLTAFAQTSPIGEIGDGERTCTLNANGNCKCVAYSEGGKVVGYECVTGSSDTAKCVCP